MIIEAWSSAFSMESKCTVLFFDEIDALGLSRGGSGDDNGLNPIGDNSGRRILSELLIQMSRISQNFIEHCDDKQINKTTNETLVDSEMNTKSLDTNSCNSENEDIDENYYTHEGKHIDMKTGKLHNKHLYNDKNIEITLNRERGGKEQSKSDKFCTKNNKCDVKPQRNIGDSNIFHDREDLEQKYHEPRIIVVAATNRPEDCDPALLRRFAVHVLVGLPSVRDRKRIIKHFLRGIDNNLTSSQLLKLSNKTEGFSGSDLESLTREAAMAPIRECLQNAALLKAKARRRKKRKRCEKNHSLQKKLHQMKCKNNNSASSDICDVHDEDDTNCSAREMLLNDFQSLRLVSFSDFEQAISFRKGNKNESTCRLGGNSDHLLYNENSDSNEE